MKRIALMMIVCGLALTGCLTASPEGTASKEAAIATHKARPSLVYANQINDANAHAMALALDAEIEYDARHER